MERWLLKMKDPHCTETWKYFSKVLILVISRLGYHADFFWLIFGIVLFIHIKGKCKRKSGLFDPQSDLDDTNTSKNYLELCLISLLSVLQSLSCSFCFPLWLLLLRAACFRLFANIMTQKIPWQFYWPWISKHPFVGSLSCKYAR